MNRTEILQRMIDTGIAAVVRMDDHDKLLKGVEAMMEGGIDCIEITMTSSEPLRAIEKVKSELEESLVGVGSVLDASTARSAILAGAEFVVSPIHDQDIVQMAHRYDKPCISGAFTPTEIKEAWEEGADVVKVFPAGMFGPGYFKAIKGPMPQIRLTPTGGVNFDTAAPFLRAGAEFLGAGSALFDKEAVRNNNWDKLQKNASTFRDIIKKAREESTSE
jgi:2-dehydro-3-deoxyphosphogluconate aldolase/(4S)-4-hydroxy-2-oxoglutarate aldolase